MRTFRLTPLQLAVHLGAWYPLTCLLLDFVTGALSANPIQDAEQRLGRAAITLLVLSLAATPLHLLFGWKEPLKRRRALGLYAFLYAALHVTVFVALDYGFAWTLIAETIIEKRYTLVGAGTLALLLPLAVTSFDVWKRILKKNWKRLHRLVYLAAPLAVLHYAWAKKGDVFQLQGDILRPLLYGVFVLVLLILRLPPVRRAVVATRGWK